ETFGWTEGPKSRLCDTNRAPLIHSSSCLSTEQETHQRSNSLRRCCRQATIRSRNDEASAVDCPKSGRSRVAPELLDYAVCLKEDCLGNCDSERLGCFEVDHEFKRRRLLDGKVGGFGAFENLVHVRRSAGQYLVCIWSIRHEPANFHKWTTFIHCGK